LRVRGGLDVIGDDYVGFDEEKVIEDEG